MVQNNIWLDINREKNKVVKIGASRGSSISWQGKFGFYWTTTFEILGIHYDITKMGEITELNINRRRGNKKTYQNMEHEQSNSIRKSEYYKIPINVKNNPYAAVSFEPQCTCLKELNDTFANFYGRESLQVE